LARNYANKNICRNVSIEMFMNFSNVFKAAKHLILHEISK